MNDDALLYEYAVVRYVPRVEREEFINVGLLMMCKRRRWLRAEMCIDEPRLLAFDPGADVGALRRQLRMFTKALPELPAEERFRWMSAVKSSVIQTSRPHPGLIPSGGGDPGACLESTFARLLEELVTPVIR